MENQLEKCVRDKMQDIDVCGVACADRSGLPLCSRGTLDSSAAPVISQLMSLASALEPNSTVPPVISFDNPKSRVVITNEGPVTVAVHRLV